MTHVHNDEPPRAEPAQTRARERNSGGTADMAQLIARLNHVTRPSGPRVGDIVVGAYDSRGERVETIFTKKEGLYVIYRARGEKQVVVHFADDPIVEGKQRCGIAPLASLRAKLNHLMNYTRNTAYFDAEVANALQLALDGRPDTGREVLSHAVSRAESRRACAGRLQYLLFAVVISACLLVALAAGSQLPLGSPGSALWLAGIGGTVGAFFSICIAIRSRSVALDIDHKANFTDSALRVLIGAIAAGGLLLFLSSGILPKAAVGDFQLSGDTAQAWRWETVLVIGFIAGFLERLFPSLIESQAPAAPTPKPAEAS